LKRNYVSISLASLLISSGLIIPFSESHALAYDDLDKKQKDISNKLSENQSKLSENKKIRSQLDSDQEKLTAELEKIDNQIITTNTSITNRQNEVKQTKTKIEKLKKEIKEINNRIEIRKKLLQDRIRSLQESGGNVNYIDVLLGAKSFSDFISRAVAINTIVDADKEILKAYKKDLELVEQKEKEINNSLDNLNADLAALESLNAKLKNQQGEKSKLLKQVKKDQKEAADELGSLENEAEILKSQNEAIKAEEAYRKQKEEEANRVAEEKKTEKKPQPKENKQVVEEKKTEDKSQQNTTQTNTATPSSNGSVSRKTVEKVQKSTDSNTSGFIKPAPGVLTSNFGARWGTTHFGVDIAQAGSDVPIYAAASGTVYSSRYSSSYGNVIFITHNINGQTYQTVYAHMSSRKVQTGDRVEQGQRIGTMGNTGESQGQHLHFEIHKGLWNAAKTNAVDPTPYIQ
jgi:peptidoglycan hydrolase CwlO-like protein